LTKKPDLGPAHRVHTSCDIEKYSQRSFGDQHFVQEQLELINERSATRAHVDRKNANVQKAGDGDITRWPAEVSAAALLADFVPALHRELVQCNRRLTDDDRIRVRFAITAGTSEVSQYGLAGPAPIVAARLVDSALVRTELADAAEHPLVVVVDDAVFQDAVEPGVHYLDRGAYREASITDESKNFKRKVWLTVPGREAPPEEESAVRRWFSHGDEPPPATPVSEPGDGATGKYRTESGVTTEPVPGPEAELGKDRPRGWRVWSTAVKAAVITATGVVVAALITAAVALANAPSRPTDPAVDGTTTAPGPTAPLPDSTAPATTSAMPTDTFDEVAANHRGTPTFADTAGGTSTAGSIPFGKHVEVSCQAPNLSGMASINAFYKVETAPWKGLYAPANTFANGDVLGSNGSHDIDPSVPACPAS
jgi:hypothetical protein